MILGGDGGTPVIPAFSQEGIIAPERPSYLLEQQHPYLAKRSTLWIGYGRYRAFDQAMDKAALLRRPCRITECRVVWRSIPL
ncbi:hypothetical protein [Sphingobium fuliginis]|uniref:Uncharacterized protein n=1 Tax=Sphingobium fuliginis ATCC 27551 TaxID=1208342 RepID=A0A5B8CGS7_SPHSA|nr:hypothetical protein [Sphingobium fuliginis]QDC37227.1 hypothetical protein FIL70_08350 [Sphingobium fuliginis ATCC 27551]